jgi:hypothetical protein
LFCRFQNQDIKTRRSFGGLNWLVYLLGIEG